MFDSLKAYALTTIFTAVAWPILLFWLPFLSSIIMTLGVFINFEKNYLTKIVIDLTMGFAVAASPFLFDSNSTSRNKVGYGFGAGIVMIIYWFKIPLLIPQGFLLLGFTGILYLLDYFELL